MPKTTAQKTNIETLPLKDFTEKAYLDYSMFVILDRALPHIGDGLKPVQRRIIYAMSELGLKASAKYKKSARTIGDVLGKFHPHGDTACYEAMVLMAQSFSYRYPLIDGQGNWGSSDDPKSFAAMRYTEAKLTAFSELLLSELGQGTVNWGPNFDGTLEEPLVLPARIPAVLLNSTMGIAVGMATDIPPHNLCEVVDACVYLLDNPKATLKDISKIIPGPDYPTGAEIITPRNEIANVYKTGTGSIRMRAIYTQEKTNIVITALPYQVSGNKILEQIATQMQSKKLPMVADLRDESDHENPTRLVIECRSNRIDQAQLMAHLFSTTDLERTYRVNFNMIGTNGKPQVKNLLQLLHEWLDFRLDTVKKRLEHRLEKVINRLHILDGLLIAFLNIDEVITIIRNEDEPKSKLIKKFKLSDTQAEAILEIKLRHLAKLEEIKIRTEQAELQQERESLEKTLQSKQRLKTLVKKELKEDSEKYGDKRRTPIVKRDAAQAMDVTEITPTEPVTIVLSQNGWVRAAKGHDIEAENLSYKSGDSLLMALPTKSNQMIHFLDSTGRSYSLIAHSFPSARSQGEPLSGRLSPPNGAKFTGAITGDEKQLVLLASNAGYGFVATIADLQCKTRNGKTVIKPPKESLALKPCLIGDMESDYLACISNQGHLLLFPIADLPQLARGKGNKIMNIPTKKFQAGEETMLDIAVLGEKDSLTLTAGKRTLTLKTKDLTHYQGERGQRGRKLPRGYQKIDSINKT